MTTQEEKIRVNARIPKSLYDFVCSEYDNMSQAINEGLEKLRESKSSEMSYMYDKDIQTCRTSPESVIQSQIPVIQEPENVIQTCHTPVIHPDMQVLTERTEEQKARIEDYKAQVQTLKAEISRLQNTLMEAPEPSQLLILQERIEGLNLVLTEKDKRIEELTQYKEDIGAFANYFKSKEPLLLDTPAEQRVKKSFFTRVKEVFIPG